MYICVSLVMFIISYSNQNISDELSYRAIVYLHANIQYSSL